jgi:hypothetical protein
MLNLPYGYGIRRLFGEGGTLSSDPELALTGWEIEGGIDQKWGQKEKH